MLDACFRSESTFLLSLVVNPCDGHDCSHLCLLSVVAVEGYVCACPDGAILEDDGRECNCKDNNTSLVDFIFTVPLHANSQRGHTISNTSGRYVL